MISTNNIPKIDSCPLCSSIRTQLLEVISGEDVNHLYASDLGISDALASTRLDYRLCSDCGLRFFAQMETGNGRFYERLQKFPWYYMDDKEEYHVALDFIPQDASILEVGAGKGEFARLVELQRYVGLEFNDLAIERANMLGVKLLKESAEEHARKGNRYGVVVSFQVLEHVPNPYSFLKNCVDCLEPGGMLIVAVPSQDGFVGDAVNCVLNMPPHHVTRWSDQSLHKIAELFGLSLVHLVHEPVAEYHKLWARRTIVERFLRSALDMDRPVVDRAFSARIISRISDRIGRCVPFSLKKVSGHTVTVCYSKSS